MPPLEIIYDGECPFCSDYVRMLRLREAAGAVVLTDARKLGSRGEGLLREGLDADDGMLVIYGGRKYLGADAANLLALLAADGNTFSVKFVNWLVRAPRRARWTYPLLRGGRNLTLRLRGRGQINPK